MSLKNSKSRTTETFNKIQKILADHGANKIMFEYENGKASSISFEISINNRAISFRLPALIENVAQIMFPPKDKFGNLKIRTDIQNEQAFKTGWANIRDWVDAQMALIDTKQVQLFQVFLPYAVTDTGETMFEKVIQNPQFLLGDGDNK